MVVIACSPVTNFSPLSSNLQLQFTAAVSIPPLMRTLKLPLIHLSMEVFLWVEMSEIELLLLGDLGANKHHSIWRSRDISLNYIHHSNNKGNL